MCQHIKYKAQVFWHKSFYEESRHFLKLLQAKFIGFIGKIMFKIIRKETNRLDIEMSGKLNTEEMEIALDELISK